MKFLYSLSIYTLTLLSAVTLTSQSAESAVTFKTLYSFQSGIFGAYPSSRLIDRNGVLYGATSSGGAFGFGTIFRLDHPSTAGSPWTLTTIYSFLGGPNDGSGPQDLTMGTFGAIYGTTSSGGPSGLGCVFDLLPPSQQGGAWTEHVLHFFSGADGGFPVAGITMTQKGVLFGTTASGGAGLNGVVYKLDPPAQSGGSWTETVLYSFSGGADGGSPSSGLAIDQAGKLYGTAPSGGASNNGVVFQLVPPTVAGQPWINNVLYSFQGGPDGTFPYGGRPVFGKGAHLYGTTFGSSLGRSNGGTVFELVPPSVAGQPWTETPIHQFGLTPDDGYGPESGVVIDSSGILFGNTSSSTSSTSNGAVFSLVPPAVAGGAWTEHVLISFPSQIPVDGANPVTPLAIGPEGAVFGTTSLGSANGFGNVFELK